MKAVVSTPEEAQKKFEENFAKATPTIIARATSTEATDAYKKNLAKFLGISADQVSDEAAKRNASLGRLTPDAMREAVRGKGSKWYANLKAAISA